MVFETSFVVLALSPLSLIGCALFGYALMMLSSPVRASLLDGFRALRRYPALWAIPGLFGFSAALFQLAKRIYFAWVLPAGERPAFLWLREAWRDSEYRFSGSPESFWWLPHDQLVAALRESRLPAFETLAGIFHCLVGTFPVSGLAAILLLINRGGHQGVLIRALQKRLGVAGWAVHLAILVCALAAVAKPLLYVLPQILGLASSATETLLQWSRVIASLSFLFEYLCSLFVQTYLMLLAFIWVRGLTFTHAHLVDFSLRRFSSVVKWAGVIMLFSVIFIEIPIILRSFAPFAGWFPEQEAFAHRLSIVRGLLAVFALAGATMQITLIFHSESLSSALRDHREFMRNHWWPFAWFIIVAALHCFALHALQRIIAGGLGEGTAPWVLWTMLFPWIAGLVLGWLLASWVCVYKRCATPAQSAVTQTKFRF